VIQLAHKILEHCSDAQNSQDPHIFEHFSDVIVYIGTKIVQWKQTYSFIKLLL
jgi:hypothetical protein